MTQPTPPASPAPDGRPDAEGIPASPRRWKRILIWAVGGAAGVLVLAFMLRNVLLGAVLDSELSRVTGGEVTLKDVAFEGLTGVRIGSIDIDVDDWTGPSANVLSISGIEATLDPWALVGSDPALSSLVAETVRLRIAERHDDPARLNVMSLEPTPGDEGPGGDQGVTSLPFGSIEVRDLEVETGIADGDAFEKTGLSRFQATIDPVPDDPLMREFFLASIDDDIDQIDLAKGTWHASSGRFELRIDDVDLERGTSIALPTAARSIIEAMQISGSVRSAMFEWTPGETPQAELSIDDLSLIPPPLADLDGAWVSYEGGRITGSIATFPRIELERGQIRMDGDVLEVRGDGGRITTTAEGVVVPELELDATLRVRLTSGPDSTSDLGTWGERVLSSAPFEATVRVVRFELADEDRGRALELPRPIAEALELLRAESWDIAATARARRGSLYADDTGTDDLISIRANLDIGRGRGMYKDFEYPLHDVTAELSIEDDVIRIESLSGLGPSEDVVELTGTITGTSDDAGVDLYLSSDSINLDDALLEALPPATEQGLRTLFDKTAAERLATANLIPPPSFYETLPQRIAENESRLLEALARGEDLEAEILEDEIRADRTIRRNGPFEVGGRGAIDLRIHRPRVLGHPVAVEGAIELFQVGAVFSRFPYPLVVTNGELILEDLAVRLEPPGLTVNTLFGGEGTVSGRVDLPRDGQGSRDVEPELTLYVQGDRLAECLLAAVPPEMEGRPSPESIPGWPGTLYSPAVDTVRAMGLTGILEYSVDISTDSEGDARFDVLGELRDGTADPSEAAEREVAAAGLLWPRDFVLSDVEATLRVDSDHVSLEAFSGHRGSGTVTARGLYDFETEVGRGIARMRNLDVESYLLDLVPAGTIEDAKRLWRRWQPTGRFDADLHLDRRGGETALRLEAEPLWAAFDTEVGRTRIDCQRGRLKFGEDMIEVVDLALALGGPDASEGALRLSGRYGLAPEVGDLRLEGILDAGQFEAAAVDEVLRLVAGEDFSNWWRTRSPRGGFTGGFEIRSGSDFAVDLDLIPTSFSMLSRQGEPDSRCGGRVVNDGRVTVDDRRVRVGPIELLSADGARAEFDLLMADVDTASLEATFALQLPSSELPETGFLPPPFASLFGENGLAAADVVANGSLQADFRKASEASDLDPTIPAYYIADGRIDFDDGRWTIGGVDLEFEPGAGGWQLGLEAIDGVPRMFELEGAIPRTLVAGRPVIGTRISGRVDPRSDSNRPWLLIDATGGAIGGGEVKVETGLEFDTTRYRTRLTVNDVDLDSIARTTGDPVSTAKERLPGILSARVDLGGLSDEPESRVGRGRVEIQDAVLTDGGSLALLQIGQLVPPIADELATAKADFWINRGMLDIEDVSLEAETLTLAGRGEMRLDDWQWSIRLLPRGPVPALSDLVSAISGTLAAVDVTGTPNDPQVNLTPLPIMVPRNSFERIAIPIPNEDSEQEPIP